MKIRSIHLAIISSLVLATACDDDDGSAGSGNGTDAGSVDTGVPEDDGGPPDTGLSPDATADAGAPDGGGDAGSMDGGEMPPLGDPLEGSWRSDFSLPGATGVVGARVTAVAIQGDQTVYAGGQFTQISGTSARGVARWTGASWEALGDGVSFAVNDLAFDDDGLLWAGGSGAGGIGVSDAELEVWDGSTWSTGARINGDFPSVEVLEVLPDGRLVAGGQFAGVDGSDSANLAIFDGDGWSAWGSEPNGPVTAVGVDADGRACIGGSFTGVGSTGATNVACWDEQADDWAAVGPGLPGQVYAIIAGGPNGELIAGGSFAYIDQNTGQVRAGIARWDGATWAPFQGGVQDGDLNIVRALARDEGGNLIVSGRFNTVDKYGSAVLASDIARWDGSEWSDIGGLDAGIGVFAPGVAGGYDLALDGDDALIVGGFFSRAGQATALGIARFADGGFSALAPEGVRYQGINGIVNSLGAGADGDLYAAGDFALAGEAQARAVARWDGTEWSDLGGTLSGFLFELGIRPGTDEVWIGGNFSAGRQLEASNLARFDGDEWQAVGGAPNGSVNAIHFASNGDVLVGGQFTRIGGVDALRVARWDGESWSQLGSGLETMNDSGSVTALAETADGSILATGVFRQSGLGRNADYLARFDGTEWSEVGGGLSGRGADLVVEGEDVYVCGTFEQAGEVLTNSVARWDGSQWHAFGDGLARFGNLSTVSSIALYGDGVFATGTFFGDGVPQQVAWWDGEQWRDLGGGLDDLGEWLLVEGRSLWVGGAFTRAGDAPSFGVARWDW